LVKKASPSLSKIIHFGDKNDSFFELKKILKFMLLGILHSDVRLQAQNLAQAAAIKLCRSIFDAIKTIFEADM